VFRASRPILSLLAGIVLVVASACSSSATPIPAAAGATSAAASAAATSADTSAAASAAATSADTSAASSAPSVADASDPNAIITSAISGGSAIKSFHIKIEVSGTIKKAILQAEAGTSAKAITSDVTLDGTAIEGDVDVAGKAANLTFNVPPMAMLGNVPLTGGLILTGGVLYYKVSLLGPKYTKQDLNSLSSLAAGLPVPTPAAAATLSISDELTQLKAQMDAAGVKATLVGVDQIGGKDANHINISFPLDKINAALAAQGSAGPAVTIDSASADVWIYKDNSQLAKVEVKGASTSVGTIDFVMTITNYDAPVTVTAPAASDINPSK
jgi:hypothetical protein